MKKERETKCYLPEMRSETQRSCCLSEAALHVSALIAAALLYAFVNAFA